MIFFKWLTGNFSLLIVMNKQAILTKKGVQYKNMQARRDKNKGLNIN